MKFFSTRNSFLTTTPARAILEGMASDGGLYLPERIPRFPMERLSQMSAHEICVFVLSSLFDDFFEEELHAAVRAAYDRNFENGDIAPLVRLDDGYVMELWHGPTCAFKDVALTLLPHLLLAAKKKCGVSEDVCILTATSGDTGSAALFGFSDVVGTRIVVFYPDGGVSPMQRRQMVTCPGKNTMVCAIRGNFDDAQSGVKQIFSSIGATGGIRLSSANSINIGRLAPQIGYYFKAYRDLLCAGRIRLGDPIRFVVPTGNFGDILAGHLAGEMGLPIGRLICASNQNRVLTDFFETGVYDRHRDFHLTSSPSMDILVSSNLERLLCMYEGTERTAAHMHALRTQGCYTISTDAHRRMKERFFAACADDRETAEIIGRIHREQGYLLDPHTAVAFSAYEKWIAAEGRTNAPTVILSTASPYKFTGTVLRALGATPSDDGFADMQTLSRMSGVPIPRPLADLPHRAVCHTTVANVGEMSEIVGRALKA